MDTKRPPITIIIIVILALIGFGAYYLITRDGKTGVTSLSGSGTIEAVTISISPEMTGRVNEVMVEEGQKVAQGEKLISLDGDLLSAQKDVASASLATANAAVNAANSALATAQKQYDSVLQAAAAEEADVRTLDWSIAEPTDFDHPLWFFDKDENRVSADTELKAAQEQLEMAREHLQKVEEKVGDSEFWAIEQRLAEARISFQIAKAVLDESPSSTPELHDSAQELFDDALADLEEAQEEYAEIITDETLQDLFEARADVEIAAERVDQTLDYQRSLLTGTNALSVQIAWEALGQANAGVEQAEAAVQQARANINLLDVQLERLIIASPSDAWVLSRSIEPGEVVTPGSVIMTLAMMDHLTITVYVPEDRYGEISIGQTADIHVDSYPGDIFTGTVSRIATQAEYTPRNVATTEGRKTTVFAITLTLDDSTSKLKPGMPADVIFN